MYKLSETVKFLKIEYTWTKLWPFEWGGCLTTLAGLDKQNLEVPLWGTVQNGYRERPQGVAEIWSSLVDVSSRNPNQNNDLPAKPLF